jgi:hypothetical protein
MRYRLVSASLISVIFMTACRGGLGNGSPSIPQSPSLNASSASTVRFQSIGPTHMSDGYPTSGKVNAVAVDPANAKIIYAASGRGTGLETYSSAGILKTTDAGNSWTRLTSGLVDPSGLVSSVVNSLWIDPKNPSILLAGTEYDGIYRTTDAGSSWTNVFSGGQTTHFVSFDKSLYATDDAGVLASTNDGKTWSVQLKGTLKQHPTALTKTEGSSGKVLYAGMSN